MADQREIARLEAKTLMEVNNSLPIEQRLGDRALNLLSRAWVDYHESCPLRGWLMDLEDWLEYGCAVLPEGRRSLTNSEQESFENVKHAGQAILRQISELKNRI